MPRQPRIEYPGAIYHVISRGNNKKVIVRDDWDRMVWLTLLADVCLEYKWKGYAYCLMDNHFHLLIEIQEETLSKGMHKLNRSYAKYFNKRHGYIGHLFQDRFKSYPVERDAYFLRLVEYIIENPVRAQIVLDSSSYRWSSYQEMHGFVGQKILDSLFLKEVAAHAPVDKSTRYFYPQVKNVEKTACV